MQTKPSDHGNILMFDESVNLEPRNAPQQFQYGRLMELERMEEIGMMACSISHDMRQLLSAIFANAEFLESRGTSASERTDLLLEIKEAALAMTDHIDSLLQFGKSGRSDPLVHEHVSSVVEIAVRAVKFHPDDQNVFIDNAPLPEADIDARNLESALAQCLPGCDTFNLHT